ncbi:CHAT domain-containing protein [Terrabacter sp. BE26]|uniref:CHAT domain-containing protein n=1 Tax=Terrabacter sp. BE26 TaxID=2898152 RepID=UPI0035BE3BF0
MLTAALEQIDRSAGGAPSREHLELRCRTLVTLALTELMLSGLEPATTRLKEAEQIVVELGDDVLRARLEYQRANIHGRVGDLASAWAGLEGAVRRLDAFSEHEQCSVHLSRGMLAFELLRPREALESFGEAARLAHALGGVEQEFMARHNEGYAAYLLGDLPRSLAGMARAEELESDVFKGPARLDRAQVLLEAGLVKEAVEALHAGLAELDREGHDQMRAEFELALARAHRLLGRVELAASAAASAREMYARMGAKAWTVKATLVELLADLDRERRRRRDRHDGRDGRDGDDVALAAAATADRLTDAATQLGDAELADNARVVAAQALLLAGDPAGANARLLGLERVSTGSLADELDSAVVTAMTLVATGDISPARRILARASRRLAAGQQGSASLDLRTARAVHGTRLAELDLELAVPRGSGAVLEALERWRSATDRLPSLGRPVDDRLAALTEHLRAVRGQLRGEVADSDQVRELHDQASRLERQIRDRDWALSRSVDAAGAVHVGLREAREHLRRVDRDLVWFFRHRGRLCAVGVIGGRATLRDLMPVDRAAELAQRVRVDLRAAATHHLGPLAGAVWSSLRSSAAELDEALVRPWRSDRGLVVVTCPEVSALPWAVFPSMRGRPFTVALSLTSFARRGSGGDDGTRGAPGSGVHVTVGPGVPRGPAEGRAVLATWGGGRPLAEPSRREELVAALARPGVVHVAAHGTHQAESPLFSSLVLHDGPVFAHELQPTGVRADHVVLSACDVGLASARPGHESLGLALSLLSLGARSVVAAVAPVPDDVAATTMTRHHRLLASGLASDEALARAVAETDDVAAAFLDLGGRHVPVAP